MYLFFTLIHKRNNATVATFPEIYEHFPEIHILFTSHSCDLHGPLRLSCVFLANYIVMILHYNTTLTPSSKAIYSGTKYYDTHIEFHSLFLDVSSTDV